MRRFFAALGLAAASSLLAGCPVYSAESCVDQSDCANGFVCDVGRNECVVDQPSSPRCSVSSDCGANHYCRQDGVCAAIDDCRWSGCPGGYVCEATSSAAPRCVIGSSGKGGSSAAGSGGSSLGGSGGSGGSESAGAGGDSTSGGAAGEGSGGKATGGSSGAAAGSTQGGSAGAAQAGAGGEAQGGASQGGASQGGASQGGASQGGSSQAGASQGGASQAGAAGAGQAGNAQAGAGQAGAGDAGSAGAEAAGSGGSSSGNGGASAGSGGSGTGGSGGAPPATCDDGGLSSASGSLQLVSQSTASACTGGLSSKPLEGKLAIAGGKGAPGDSWTFEAIGVAASQPEIHCNEGGVVCSFTYQRTEGTSTTRYTSTAAPFTVKVTIWNDGSFIGTGEQVKTIRRVTVPGQTDQQVVEGVTLVMVATSN